MGLAFYRFGHDIALRLASGQAFALKNAELGASFGPEIASICFLRGTFTPNSFRGLKAQGVIPPELMDLDLAQPVAVQLDLLPELAAVHGASAESLQQMGLRLDQNSLTDELARRLLLFDVWNLSVATPVAQADETMAGGTRLSAQVAAIFSLFDSQESDSQESGLPLDGTEFAETTESPSLPSNVPPSMATPMSAQEVVTGFFEAEEWPLESLSVTGEILRSVYDGENGSWMCYTRILSEFDQALFYSVCPIAVPPVVVPSMMEFLNRANTELPFGNFELDFDTNSVRLRTSVDFKNTGLTSALFRNVVFQNLAVMNNYLPTILRIVALQESAMPVG